MKDLKQNFISPPDEFSPAPFWFLNDELDRAELKRQLVDFYDKGIRSVVLHPRKGLPVTTPYLSEAFLDYMEYLVEEAQKLDMTVILYDEAMYPSGSCRGQVVAHNPDFAAKGLRMQAYTLGDPIPVFGEGNWFVAAVASVKGKDGTAHKIGFDSMEAMVSYLSAETAPYEASVFTLVYSQGTIRGIHPDEDDGEANAPKAADLLDIDAVKTFINLTHDVYYRRLHKYFGNTIIAMFTDEPSIMGRNHLPGLIPWTHGFLDFYLANGGCVEALPQLFDQSNPENHNAVLVYNHAINLVMKANYFKPISDWCTSHGIALTGHPIKSDDIGMLKFFHIPCQDIVWRYIDPDLKNGLTGEHSTMGKCSSDAARHSGKRRNGNECFGACGHKDDPWDFPFTDMKWYLNWLFARGVNLIIPHAFYYSLREERVNERPPDVGPNSPWWDDYPKIAAYIRRMCWINTDSVNVTDIAILCNGDHLPWKPAQALYENQLEFNYLETDLLESCTLCGNALHLEQQSYRVILVEDGLLISKQQQAVLDAFRAAGGTVIHVADFCDDTVLDILKQFNPSALKPLTNPKDLRITHVIRDSVHFYMMVNESDEAISFEAVVPVSGRKEIWNPWEGTFREVAAGDQVSVKLEALEALILAVEV